MSSGAEGAVLALPLAIAGVTAAGMALAVVGVAGVGVVVLREGARASLACGRELKQLAEQNLAAQRALRRAALGYEAELRQQDLTRAEARIAGLQARIDAQQQTFDAHQRAIAALKSQQLRSAGDSAAEWEALRALRERVFAAAPPEADAEATQLNLLSGWARRVRRARELVDKLDPLLQTYVSGQRQGLFDTRFLLQLRDEVRAKLSALERTATDVLLRRVTPDTDALEQALADLSYLDRRLNEMETQTPQRRKQRADALAALEQAQTVLAEAARTATTEPQIAGLAIASKTLDDALAAIAVCEFQRAQTAAEATRKHLGTIERVVAQQRQRNLTQFLDQLAESVSALRELPTLSAPVAAWQERQRACQAQAGHDLDGAWALAEALGKEAEALQRQSLDILMRASVDSFSAIAGETLEEMGYQARVAPSDGDQQLLEGSQGDRRIRVVLGQGGRASLSFEGYGDSSCQAAQREFLDRLRARGVIGAWKEHYSLTRALDRVVLLLQRNGLDVRVEPSDDGVTVLASGQVADGSDEIGGTITNDGSVWADERWRARIRTGAIEEPAENLRRQQEQAEHWRRQQEQFEAYHQANLLRTVNQ